MNVIATIGHFDGVHKGHQYVIRRMMEIADAQSEGCDEKSYRTLVITFDRHPRTIFNPDYQPQMLTTLDERIEKLKRCGIDDVQVLTFDHQTASLTAREFMQKVLRDKYGVTTLVLGYDNRFGRRTADSDNNFDDYVAYGLELGIEVVRCAPYRLSDGTCVSSTLIRQLIEQGKDVTNLL